jgi:esterase
MSTPAARARLSASTIAGSGPVTRHLVMLHGIYGRGRNWQAIARRVTADRPEYACWLVDLPHHGDSRAGSHGDTIAGLAADVQDWLSDQRVEPAALLGHSFGGKVALAMAAAARDRPLQLWVIDSTPEARSPSGSAWDMLRVVRDGPDTFATRDAAAQLVEAGGFASGVAQWMTTNLERQQDGFRWRLDLDTMEALLADFFATDLWRVVDPPAPEHVVHVLKASRSSVITPEALTRLEARQGERVHVHHLDGSHWVHAESPDAVAGLLVAHLPR